MRAVLISLLLLSATAHAEAPTKLEVALYAPAAAFADSSARLAYVQGLAKAIQQKTGIPTSGKAYVRLGDLNAAHPDFAVIDGQCLSERVPGALLATAVVGGETAQAWALYTRGGDTLASLASLRGKKLVYLKTGCRDVDFLDNAMLSSEVKTATFFGALIDKPDVAGAVGAVRDYKNADAVFAPASQAHGLTKIYEGGSVPNAGFVVTNKGLQADLVDNVKAAVLGYGGGGGLDGWKPASPGAYTGLAGRMGARVKRAVFALPETVRVDELDVILAPASKWEQAPVKQHFWEPTAAEQ
jgi:hypothetical protein